MPQRPTKDLQMLQKVKARKLVRNVEMSSRHVVAFAKVISARSQDPQLKTFGWAQPGSAGLSRAQPGSARLSKAQQQRDI